MTRSAFAPSICLLAWISMSCAVSPAFAKAESVASMPKYESVADPAGVKATRILVEDGGVLHFGYSRDEFSSLIASDIGFSLVFEKVAGGIRARGYPIVFPDGDRALFEFDDYSCAAQGKARSAMVICTGKKDGRRFRSLIEAGGLIEFELWCLDAIDKVCRYRLVGGQAIRPNKVQPAS